MRHERDERRLAKVSALACHVGARDDHRAVLIAVQEAVVGHKAVFGERFDDGMAAVLYFKRAVFGDLGAAVLIFLCDDGEGEEAVELRDGRGELLEDGDILGEDGQNFVEELLFEAAGALVAAQNLAFELFELFRRVAFAVRERLTAHIGIRDFLLEGVAHLDIVAEHAVEAHFQSADARAFALARFEFGDEGAALRPDVAEGIERFVVAAADEVPLFARRRRLGNGAV